MKCSGRTKFWKKFSVSWGLKEPTIFAEDFSSDVFYLSINFDKFIKILTKEKSNILNLTERIAFYKCITKINLIYLHLVLLRRKLTANSKELTFYQNKQMLYLTNFILIVIYFKDYLLDRVF